MIRLIVFDIDGVLTDGMLQINAAGEEQKRINLKDVDAIFELKQQGYLIGAITGEQSPIVEYFRNKFPWDHFYSGKKNKKCILQEIERISALYREEICYVGDGKYDVEALSYAGLGICPQDAVEQAKEAADMILTRCAGEACLWEIVKILECSKEDKDNFSYIGCQDERRYLLKKQLISSPEFARNITLMGRLATGIHKEGRRIFLCGDMGCEGIEQYMVSELNSQIDKRCYEKNMRSISLNTTVLSTRDICDSDPACSRLSLEAQAGDMVIGISANKPSENLYYILKHCKESGMHVGVLTGTPPDDSLYELAEARIELPDGELSDIRELQTISVSMLAQYIAEIL